MDELTAAKIQDQIEQMNELIESYRNLLDITLEKDPDLIEVSALGSVLHSFYNGIEGIFTIIAKKIDRQIPDGPNRHKDLLAQMSEDIENRITLINKDQYSRLHDYLRFRHFFRHSYTYYLDWSLMKPLVHDLEETWNRLEESIRRFIAR